MLIYSAKTDRPGELCYNFSIIFWISFFLLTLAFVLQWVSNITNLDLSKAPDHDCIPVMVLNQSGPELSYILAELFNMFLKESYFPDCWVVSSVVPVFKNVGERSTTKNYHLVSLLYVGSEIFEKPENVRFADDLGNVAFFLISSIVSGLLIELQIF